MHQIPITGVIGWDTMPESVRASFAAAGGADVELFISSPGGYVGDALEIFNMVRAYPGKVTARLSGYAMSAASYIPMAADEVIVEDNAVMMIHNAQGMVYGSHKEMEKYADILRGLSALLAQAYVRKTGMEKAEITALLDAESWFFGEEIIQAGFADAMVPAGDGAEDEEAAIAGARLEFELMVGSLSKDKQRATADLSRAAQALGDIGAQPPSQSEEEITMDLTTLKEQHPDLVAAIMSEAAAEIDEKLAAARAQGATDERQRAAAVRAQLLPGHEALIEALVEDGVSDGPASAMAIIEAEKALRAQQSQAIERESNPPVASVIAPDGPQRMTRSAWQQLSPDDQRAFIKNGGTLIDAA